MQGSTLSQQEIDDGLKLARALRDRTSDVERLLGTRLLVYIAGSVASYYDAGLTFDEDHILHAQGSWMFIDRADLSGGSSHFSADDERDFPFLAEFIENSRPGG